MASIERSTIITQLEHLQSKHVGTGHADITKADWIVNHHRDSHATYIGHPNMIALMAIADGQSIARMKHYFKMVNHVY